MHNKIASHHASLVVAMTALDNILSIKLFASLRGSQRADEAILSAITQKVSINKKEIEQLNISSNIISNQIASHSFAMTARDNPLSIKPFTLLQTIEEGEAILLCIVTAAIGT